MGAGGGVEKLSGQGGTLPGPLTQLGAVGSCRLKQVKMLNFVGNKDKINPKLPLREKPATC